MRRLTYAVAIVGLAGAALLSPMLAHAQVQRSYLNPGFEVPVLTAPGTAGCWRSLTEALVPGWTTTHSVRAQAGDCAAPTGTPNGPAIELWRTPYNGVPARTGNNHAELNAFEPSRIYQNVCLINGDRIDWRFSHRGRLSATVRDQMAYNVGASVPIVTVATTSSGAFDAPVAAQGTVNAPADGGSGWRDYTGSFVYAGASGVTSMGFEAISTAGNNPSNGNFLDNIQIQLKPFVEFVQPSSSTPESASSNLPTLRVNGTAFSNFTVNVVITGGTATRGTDYTTPGNSATLTITIPGSAAGIVYDGTSASSLFPLPITVVQDALAEGNETIALQVQPSTAGNPPFLLQSSASCGGVAQSTWTYTIVDDDARITVEKSAAAPVAVAGQPTQFDVTYTIVVTNPSATLPASYGLTDSPGMDQDASVVSASFTRNGGSPTALTGAGPWTLQPQWRTLAANGRDTYVLTTRISIARGGSTANDTCGNPSVPNAGLHNEATATVQANSGTNPTFTDSGCQNTPTPAWVTLNKVIATRVSPSDQFQIRVRSPAGGTASSSAITSGTGTTATTTVAIPAGNTLQLDESLKANGTGADEVPVRYASDIACTNRGVAMPSPSGAGTDVVSQRRWLAPTLAAGDDITCTITNAPAGIDLAIAKTNTPGAGPSDQAGDALVSGAVTTYTLTVSNNSALPVTGAVVRDTPGAGLTCPAAGVVTCNGPAGACPAGASTIGTLTSANGLTLGTLAGGASLTLQFNCTVD